MALKNYHKETLNDNWYEERAAPLNGVLPSDNVKEYSTTAGTDYRGAKSTQQRHKPRMVGEHNLNEAMQLTAAATDRGFRSSLPQPDDEAQRRYLDTTHRTAFVNHFPHSASSSSSRGPPGSAATSALSLVPAGGAGGRNIERSKAASGAMGEVFRTSDEPQRDTCAQRSWLYSTDPMIVAMQAKAAAKSSSNANNSAEATATAAAANAKPEHYRRQSTSITTSALTYKGVYEDD